MKRWYMIHKYTISKYFKRTVDVAFTFIITIIVATITNSYIIRDITPAIERQIEAHLYLSLLNSRTIVEKNKAGLDIIYNYLVTHSNLVLLAQSDRSSQKLLLSEVKNIINNDPYVKNLIFELQSNNTKGKTQYIYIYIPILENVNQTPNLIFVLDAEMFYGDEIYPGYPLVTDNMSGFLDVIYSKKVQFIKNTDEFGDHYSIVAPVNNYEYNNVFIGVDYNMNGEVFRAIRESKWVIFIAMFVLSLAFLKLKSR